MERAPHLAQQVEDLGLDGDIERRRRLVGDEERRLRRQRDGDHRALPQAAAELMRVLVDAPRGIRHADGLEQLERAAAGGGAAGEIVDGERLADLVADGVDGIQRDHRLLEHEADAAPADPAHRALVEPEEILAVERDAAAGDPARRHHEPDDRQRGDRLAAAGLADEAERLAPADAERHVVDRRRVDAAEAAIRRAQRKHRAQVLDLEQRDQVWSSRCSPNTRRSASDTSPSVARCSTAAMTWRHEVRAVPRRRLDRGDRALPRGAVAALPDLPHGLRLTPLALRIDPQQLDRCRRRLSHND